MPPKKNTKLSLTDFLNDEATGKVNWADDLDDLPIAPRGEGAPRRGGDYLSTVPDRADRDRMMGADRGPPREELPLPTKAPFTAFVGNLSFDVTEGEIESFFAPSQLKGVRIIERDGRPKGFAYVEFDTLDGLKEGLARSGSQMANRTVRVSVADAPKGGAGGFGGGLSSVAEEASQWRRAGPLPSGGDAPPSGFARRGSDRPGFGRQEADGPSGFDNMEVGAGGRSGFGSRFTASPAGRERDGPAGDDAETWRSSRRPSAPARGTSQGGDRYPSPGGAAAPPAERKKLELKPRSTPVSDNTSAPAPATPSTPGAEGAAASRANPFGSAKPVDAAEHTPRVESASQSQVESVETDANQSPAPRAPAPTGAWGGGRKPSGALGAGTAEAQVESVDSSANGDATPKDNPVDAATAGVASISTA
ncbi:FOG: RRM domain [Ceraceosorus bombacis]|uniref:FOG: RRM domain n=1 Tax=Ceraceosorus bombacis TaxID=401625 RepID=A0A0P1BHW8_9BASI|nr:FOG: RRM domain [Ceraceosorus bombacis]